MLILTENVPSIHITGSSQSPDEEKSLAKHLLDTIMVSLYHV